MFNGAFEVTLEVYEEPETEGAEAEQEEGDVATKVVVTIPVVQPMALSEFAARLDELLDDVLEQIGYGGWQADVVKIEDVGYMHFALVEDESELFDDDAGEPEQEPEQEPEDAEPKGDGAVHVHVGGSPQKN